MRESKHCVADAEMQRTDLQLEIVDPKSKRSPNSVVPFLPAACSGSDGWELVVTVSTEYTLGGPSYLFKRQLGSGSRYVQLALGETECAYKETARRKAGRTTG